MNVNNCARLIPIMQELIGPARKIEIANWFLVARYHDCAVYMNVKCGFGKFIYNSQTIVCSKLGRERETMNQTLFTCAARRRWASKSYIYESKIALIWSFPTRWEFIILSSIF